METINKYETMSQESLKLAKQEKELAKESLLVGKSEIKRAKAREMLVKEEMDLARIKREWAEKKINLVIEKRNLKKKGYIEIEEMDLKNEEEIALYNQKVAIVQEQIAKINTDIAYLERKIAKRIINLVDDKLDAADEREKLGKKQMQYVKDLKQKAAENKLSVDQADIASQENALNKARNTIIEVENEIRNKQIELANLKKDLSTKLSEREKIRPISNKSEF
jgi:hypothetical protein